MKITIETNYNSVTVDSKKEDEDIYAVMDLIKSALYAVTFTEGTIYEGFKFMAEEDER